MVNTSEGRPPQHQTQMNLAFTTKQLTPETIATILNGAYIKTELITRNEGTETEYVFAQARLHQWTFEIVTGRFDDIIFRAYVPFDKSFDQEKLKKTADYMDNYPVDTTYIANFESGDHMMCFHYNHVLPEDETISPAYLVKLTRYFVKYLNQFFVDWKIIEQHACETA